MNKVTEMETAMLRRGITMQVVECTELKEWDKLRPTILRALMDRIAGPVMKISSKSVIESH